MAESQAGDNFKLLDIEIGLVEAIEHHQGARTRSVQLPREVRDGTEKMGNFYGNRDRQAFPQLLNEIAVVFFDLRCRPRRIGYQ